MKRIIPTAGTVLVLLIVLMLGLNTAFAGNNHSHKALNILSQADDSMPDIPEGYSLVDFLTDKPLRTFAKAEDVLEPNQDYQAIIVTNKGTMVVDLFEQAAPKTVNNFVFLALNHFYDGIVFHRVIDGFMAQTGDPTGTGSGGPGYSFADEVNTGKLHDSKGIVSMANSGPNTNGSQFFITFVPTEHLNGRHSVFGKVISGLDVLDKINRITPGEPDKVTETAYLDESLDSIIKKGIKLEKSGTQTLEEYIVEQLSEVPEIGKKFSLGNIKAISGRIGTKPAIGFYGGPDKMLKVYIIKKAKEAQGE